MCCANVSCRRAYRYRAVDSLEDDYTIREEYVPHDMKDVPQGQGQIDAPSSWRSWMGELAVVLFPGGGGRRKEEGRGEEGRGIAKGEE